jgi:hypothetical protein
MAIGRTAVDTVPGAVTAVSGSSAITALRSMCRARQGEARRRSGGCLRGRLLGCSRAGRDEVKSSRPGCELIDGFPVGRSAVSRCWSSRVADGLTFAAGEASAWAWG